MNTYIVYEKYSGRILHLYEDDTVPESEDKLSESLSILALDECQDRRVGYTHYVVDGALAERPVMSVVIAGTEIVANKAATFTISGVPSGSKVGVMGPVFSQWVQEDGLIEIDTDIAGEYRVLVECWPYQDLWVDFNAT